MIKFLIASNNQHKVCEMNRILRPLGVNAVPPGDCGISLEDVKETGSVFAENAEIKARAAFNRTGMPSVADDSGLLIDALGGRPGVFSARYAGAMATDRDKYNKILQEMKDVPPEKRTARFVSSICCIMPDGTKIVAEGTCEGKIALSPQGDGGFGYDPIFLIRDGRSFAQLTSEEKDAVSHRGAALRKFKKELQLCFEGNK